MRGDDDDDDDDDDENKEEEYELEYDHDTKWNVWEDWKIVCIILLKIELTTVAHINPSDGVNYSKINYEMWEWVSKVFQYTNNKTHKQHKKWDDMSTSAIKKDSSTQKCF